jgi:site-specific recombinase XerD
MRRLTRDRFLSDFELARFMAAVRTRQHKHQPRDHALFALLANTGIRPSEALALKRSDMHLAARPPWIRLARIRRRHGPHPVNELIVHSEVAAVVLKHLSQIDLDPATPLFQMTKRQPPRLFRYYSNRAGIYPFKVYALRHSAGLRIWRTTRDLRMIQAILGHVRLKAAMSYVHVTPETITGLYEKIGAVL